MIYPVPQYSASLGLFEIKAAFNATTSKQSSYIHHPTKTSHRPRAVRLTGNTYRKNLVSINEVVKLWNEDCSCYNGSTSVNHITHTLHSTKVLQSTSTLTKTASASSHTGKVSTSRLNSTSDVTVGSFSGMWLGALGGCLQKRSGVLVCTSSSL